MPGMYVISISTRMYRARYGRVDRTMVTTGFFSTDCTTKIFRPKGGVKKPMDRFMVKTIPKWRGSMPRARHVGSNMGARISIAAPGSKKLPMTSSRIFRKSKNSNRPRCASESDSIWGSWAMVAAWAKAMAEAIRMKICEVILMQ